MQPEQLQTIEQYGRIAMTLSPLLLLAFASVRRVAAKATSWIWRPFAEQFAKRDRVLRSIEESVSAMRQQLAVVVGTLRLQADNADVGYFESDQDGRNTYVNRTYCRWLHCAPSELLEWGFLGFVHPADREQVRGEWVACLRDHRDYRARMRMGSPQLGYREYDVVARPIPESPPAIAWAGTVRPAHGQFQD